MGKHKRDRNTRSSSSSEEWVEAEIVEKKTKYRSSSASSEEELISKRNKRCSRYTSSESSGSEKRSKHKKCKSRHRKDSRSSHKGKKRERKSKKKQRSRSSSREIEVESTNKREDWMSLSTNFSSFSNLDRRKQREDDQKKQKEDDKYNPGKCPRELNPYWKDGGDGLPKFQKPREDDDDTRYRISQQTTSSSGRQSNWRKSKINEERIASGVQSSSSKNKEATPKTAESIVKNTQTSMSEKELNLLAGKLVKAEIMGNEKLVKELNEKLEMGRKALEEAKAQGEAVLLTQMDKQGHSKPLSLQSEYETGNRKERKKVLNTHDDKQRVRYFPDDDKYSLKQMFENEKFNTTNDQDSEFMRIAAKIRKNDDLDDLFADNVRRAKSDSKIDEARRSQAISEHKKMSESLDNCPRCIQSTSTQKHLIISMGEYVYLSLPPHEPLIEGHCFIIPIRHVPCVTQLDENEWSEIRDFRKALVRMFDSKDSDPVFYEIATGLHRYPHMIMECVPLPKEEGDMAPIYFKKAIDESETEWSQNKKLVSLKGRDVRRAIPKGLPYFSVSFGMEEGFAHVVEDEKLFPRNFAQEIIGGMLDLHHSKWRKPLRESYDVQSKRVLDFSEWWKDFDCSKQ